MTRAVRRCLTGWLCGALAMTALEGAAQPAPNPFAACREQFARQPDDYESSYCFYQVGLSQRLLNEAAREFDGLLQRHPDNFWVPMAYGHVYRRDQPDRAEALYRRSADGFRRVGHAEGEILARSNLRNFLFPLGRSQDVETEMARVIEIGASVSEPLVKARVWNLEAGHLQETGGDLGRAYMLLKQTEQVLFPDGPYRMKRSCLTSLGQVAFSMGRTDEALTIFRQLEALAIAEKDAQVQASARYYLLNTTAQKEGFLPSPGARQRLMVLAERALAAGLAAQQPFVQMKTHRAMAELLARQPDSVPVALSHIERCLALAVSTRQPHDEAYCSWFEAALVHRTDPQRARAAELRALEATNRANNPRTYAQSAGRHMRLSWETNPRARAIEDSLAAIAAIETLRALQDDDVSSADLFSAWMDDYYWLSGRILRDAGDAGLDLAFSVTERMRARSLLNIVERSRAPADAASATHAKRRTILEAIATVQRRLMAPTLPEAARQKDLAALEALERDDLEARRQIALSDPVRSLTPPTFASVGALQSSLADDEALLSFQVGLWETYDGDFGGGSWVVVLTRYHASIHRLPDRAQLAPVVPVFTGLINREDGLEAAAAERLYGDLLRDALAALPPGVERLILVPDGMLHHVPFDALRPARDAPPVGERYALTVVPSATLLLHWRAQASGPISTKALALVDPELATGTSTRAQERNATLRQGLRLGRLPHARREGRAIERRLGVAEVLVGEDASERALKERDLRQFGLLHLAAHAVADEAYPERSAVLLSAGSEREDGLLQAREISGLDLEGGIIVLSACETAAGAVLNGEGMLSLGRSFFEAGAHAVIGSRWPLRDAEAASLFDTFYRHLGNGSTLSEALTATRRAEIAAGRPAAVWASLVLLGNGDLRPFPAGRVTPPGRPIALIGAAAMVGMLLLVVLVRFLTRTSRRG